MSKKVTAAAPVASSAAFDADYPAANFQPTVIYIDKNQVKASTGETSVFDSKYPAANFEPKVIYP